MNHPDHDDLAFLYGSILTDGNEADTGRPTRNVCVFAGSVMRETRTGGHDAIIARVADRAFYSGKSEFIVEPDDVPGQGFLPK